MIHSITFTFRKIPIMVGKVCLKCKCKKLLGVNKLLKTKSLLTSPNNVLPYYLQKPFPPIIWIFTESEGDGIKSRRSSEIFSTLKYWVKMLPTIFTTVLHQTISFFQIYFRRIESFHGFLNWKWKIWTRGKKPTAVLIFATQCVISRFFLYVTPHNKGHFMDVLL